MEAVIKESLHQQFTSWLKKLVVSCLFKETFIDELHVLQVCQVFQDPLEILLMRRTDTKVFILITPDSSWESGHKLNCRVNFLYFSFMPLRIWNAEFVGEGTLSIWWPH